jgi:hypothetical protein
MLYVAAEREKSLVAKGYVVFHVERRHALVESSHHYGWNFNIREDVHGHPRERGCTQDDDHKRSDNDHVRIAQRETWHDANSQSRPGANAGGFIT